MFNFRLMGIKVDESDELEEWQLKGCVQHGWVYNALDKDQPQLQPSVHPFNGCTS